MKTIYYLVNWGKIKERAWSGTSYSLYKALKTYFNVYDIDLTKKITTWGRIKNRIIGLDMGLSEIQSNRKKLEKVMSSTEKRVVFQFVENIFDTDLVSSYIYLDLSASYVDYMKNHKPQVFIYSNSKFCREKAISMRSEYQTEYFRSCSGIFTMGQWLADDLIQRCGIAPSKVHCVGGGINLNKELIDYSHKQGNKILFVGRDFSRKGGYIVVDAFKRLRERRPDVELYVAGPAVNPVQEVIEGYHYVGDCDYEKTAYLFNLCDIFVMPSYFEAYGLVFIEALSFGLPVIARDDYEMKYIVEEGKSGLLLKKDDPIVLSDMMSSLLTDSKIKNYVRSKRDFYLSEYSWDKVAERIYAVIEENEI